jgi:hypothetical protein
VEANSYNTGAVLSSVFVMGAVGSQGYAYATYPNPNGEYMLRFRELYIEGF